MSAQTQRDPVAAVEGQRQLQASDGNAYGALLYFAYHGSVDDDGETLEDGLAVGPQLLANDRAHLIRHSSAGIWLGKDLIAAVLILKLRADYWVDPIVVHPDFKQQGLGYHLMRWASAGLHSRGINQLRLAVTDTNEPAMALYRKLGYVRDGPWPSSPQPD